MTTLPRRWRIAIAGSLLLNVLVIAALATLALRHGRDGADGATMAAGLPSPRAMQRVLQPHERAAMAEVFGPRRRAIGLGLVELGEARAAVRDALLAEPFDPAALEEAFGVLRAQDATLAGDVHAGLAELAARLDADGRRRLAEGLRPPRGREPGRGDGERRHDGRHHEARADDGRGDGPRGDGARGDDARDEAPPPAERAERREAMREAMRERIAERMAERRAERRARLEDAAADGDAAEGAAEDAASTPPAE